MNELYLIAILIVVFTILSKFAKDNTSTALSKESIAPAFVWPSLENYEFEIVGESFHQPALRSIAGDHGVDAANLLKTAILIPDDKNPHDNKAVKVMIDGYHVGHLSRDDARSYRRRLAAKKQGMVAAQCGAMVTGGFVMKDGKRASYGVVLDIKPFG